MSEFLVNSPRNGWSPPADEQAGDGVPVLTLSAITGFRYNGLKVKYTSAKTKKSANYWLKTGELLITRSNTLELVGHTAIYDGTPAPCICPDLIMKMTIRHEVAETRFIYYWLQSVINIPVPKVSPTLQKQVVSYLDRLNCKLDEILCSQREVEAELITIFISAVLAKAFRGEL